nr:MAG TPA: hypothetical protein [Caudoviricetes sp.]
MCLKIKIFRKSLFSPLDMWQMVCYNHVNDRLSVKPIHPSTS